MKTLLAFVLWVLSIILHLATVLLSPLVFIIAASQGKAAAYLENLARGNDRTANAYLGGDPRETISSRLVKRVGAGNKSWASWFWKLILAVDPDHGRVRDDSVGSDDLDLF